MQKKLWIPAVMLLIAFGFLAGRSLGSADSLPTPPQIIRRVALTGQTVSIPHTLLFTPTKTGLYRISVYATTTSVQDPSGFNSYSIYWSDDAGTERSKGYMNLIAQSPPSAWAKTTAEPGSLAVIEAVAGQPVRYSTDIDGITYSLYITVERLAP